MNQAEVETMWGIEADVKALKERVKIERELTDYWFERAIAAERKLNFAENGSQFK
jgi:hypothetical protein